MHGVLSALIYWLNFNILFFWVGRTIPQKPLIWHIFSWHLSLFSVLKEWRQFKK